MGGAGTCDGWGSNARFARPVRVAIDRSGNLYVADQASSTVRKISPQGAVQTLAGYPGKRGTANGTGFAARLQNPSGIAVDANGFVYVSDGNAIRKISPIGEVTPFAGSVSTPDFVEGTGTAARFSTPTDLAIDNAGNVLVADSANNRIRSPRFLHRQRKPAPIVQGWHCHCTRTCDVRPRQRCWCARHSPHGAWC